MIVCMMNCTALAMLNLSMMYELNTWEFIFLRCGLTFYAGWLMAATILNIAYFCKANGFQRDQETWAIRYLVAAFIWYNTVSYWYLNPLYGAVLCWVIFGVRSRAFKDDNMKLHAATAGLGIAYGVAFLGQCIYAVVVYSGGK
jgi:hypothetical protein